LKERAGETLEEEAKNSKEILDMCAKGELSASKASQMLGILRLHSRDFWLKQTHPCLKNSTKVSNGK